MPNTSLDIEDRIANKIKGVLPFRTYLLVEKKQTINMKITHMTISHSDKVIKKINKVMGKCFKYKVKDVR